MTGWPVQQNTLIDRQGDPNGGCASQGREPEGRELNGAARRVPGERPSEIRGGAKSLRLCPDCRPIGKSARDLSKTSKELAEAE
jgi:hypothetical protein